MHLLLLTLQCLYLVSVSLVSCLPDCSSNSGTPCTCPAGTEFQESATFAVIGSAATDVRDLIASFFKPTWFGLLPYATTGKDFHPGATRSYTFPTSIGIYNITEELTLFHTSPSGSFIWKLEQAPSSTPTEYRTGNGSFSGYWATMRSDAVFQNETSIVWSVYLCATGHPLNFAKFQTSSLKNAISLLMKDEKLTGETIQPRSIQNF